MQLLRPLLIYCLWACLVGAQPIDRQKLIKELQRHAGRRPIGLPQAKLDVIRQTKSAAVDRYPLTFLDALKECMKDNVSTTVDVHRRIPSYQFYYKPLSLLRPPRKVSGSR